VRVRKEAVGHIANRLTAALYQEAVHIVAEGIGTVEDVDDAVRYGPGLRYAIMGPHLTYHLAGGEAGIRHFLEHLAPGQERRFADLGRVHFDEAVKAAVIDGVEAEAAGRDVASLERERDAALVAIIGALHNLPRGGG
jgi:3-hydroxyacyl-CoA dehydrogenase